MNIEDINAVEFAAAVGHVTAGQAFGILQQGGCWIGPDVDDDDQEAIIKAAMVLGEYVCTRTLVPGQLMTYAAIERLRTDDDDVDVHRNRAGAYELFTVTAAHAFTLITREQQRLAEEKARQANLEAVKPIPIKDTIFAPYGTLDEMEDYQKQFLADTEREQQRLLEEQQRVTSMETDDGRILISGGPVPEPTMPAMTLGQAIPTTNESEDQHEEETADPGQETGSTGTTAEETPEAVRPAGDAGSERADPEGLPAADVSPAGEAGSPAALPGDDGAGEEGERKPVEQAPVTAEGGEKPAKGKSAN
ncbi:ICP22 family protein [Rhizobium sp. CAU 1783]